MTPFSPLMLLVFSAILLVLSITATIIAKRKFCLDYFIAEFIVNLINVATFVAFCVAYFNLIRVTILAY